MGIENKQKKIDLSIVMPCRNEEKAVGKCISRAERVIQRLHVTGEIVIADNSSTDKSVDIARKYGARVIHVRKRGYGRTLRAGLKAARGNVIIMADADTTYDFLEAPKLYELLSEGKCDVVIGNRFAGGIEHGAMPISHKIGVRLLSFLGRLRFKTDVKDFHCGFRGITREALNKMTFHTTGMEFATEMIAAAAASGLTIGQVPVKLKKCKVKRKSKLRTVRDGYRHLHYICHRDRFYG